MSVIVVDTDVASRILKHRLPAELESELTGHTLAMSFVTVVELAKWTLVRKWGPSRLGTLTTFVLRVGVLPYDLAVARKWGGCKPQRSYADGPDLRMTPGSPPAASLTICRWRRVIERISKSKSPDCDCY